MRSTHATAQRVLAAAAAAKLATGTQETKRKCPNGTCTSMESRTHEPSVPLVSYEPNQTKPNQNQTKPSPNIKFP